MSDKVLFLNGNRSVKSVCKMTSSSTPMACVLMNVDSGALLVWSALKSTSYAFADGEDVEDGEGGEAGIGVFEVID